MFGLPKDCDFSIFVGQTLESVSFLAYAVHLSFDNELSITIESSYTHKLNPQDQDLPVRIPPQESTLMQLAGSTIESAAGNEDGTLTLQFSNGHVLKCYDDIPNYECYRITYRGTDTFV
jgi:hypothetical protein